jgi:hypothetical protein
MIQIVIALLVASLIFFRSQGLTALEVLALCDNSSLLSEKAAVKIELLRTDEIRVLIR